MQVPFGRYKGQDISVMAADTEYAKTQLGSAAICEAFLDFVAALREALNFEPTPQTEPTPAPKAAATDRREVSERKRKALPSSLRLQYAYQWLCSFDMAFRVRGRCTPETKCRFLVDWLPDLKRKEFLERGDLSWLDWNACFDCLTERQQLEHQANQIIGKDHRGRPMDWREFSDEDLRRLQETYRVSSEEAGNTDHRFFAAVCDELIGEGRKR